jgi:inosose dehydratase
MSAIGNGAAPGDRAAARLRLGTCPDSWGVWFADDPLQTPWQRFLDEVADVGYEWLELGPYGYLPTDPARLADEVGRRGLNVAAGTMHGRSGLHRAGDWPGILSATRKVAALTAALGARHLVFVPVPGYRDDRTGAFTEPAELGRGDWQTLVRAATELGKVVAEEHGVRLQFHPHADSHVETQQQTERFLEDTDPRYVSLCLDTGHLAYRHADSVAIIRGYPERIGYVHVKQMDPAVVQAADRDGLAFGQAVGMGASCEPPLGEPRIEPVASALRDLGTDLFVVVEQDMYPVDFDLPKPIAQRTYDYLRGVGIGGPGGTGGPGGSGGTSGTSGTASGTGGERR